MLVPKSISSVFLAAVLALSLVAPGCTTRAAENASHTLTIRLLDEPETLDWNKAHTPVETYLLTNLMEGLVDFDSAMKVEPALAKSWKVSPDGKTYTFYLRQGVKWSDGVPLKAQDFVYSWKRLLAPQTAASYAYFLFDIRGAEAFNQGKIRDFSKVGVKALSDSVLQVKLARPLTHWIDIPTFWVTYPLRKDVVEKWGNDASSAWARPERMVSLGPFTLASHEYDEKIVLKSNPRYYGRTFKKTDEKLGNVQNVVGLIVKDDSTALTLYESGRIDFLTDISSLDLKRLAGRPDLKTFPYYKTAYLGLVTTQPPLTDVHVRQAIAMAINKDLIGRILHGGEEPATSWVPPRLMGHSDNLGFPFDPQKAREVLHEARGVDLTKPVTVIVPNFDGPDILAQYIQNQLHKNLGLNVQIQQFDNKTFRAQLNLKTFPLFIMSWSADYPDPDNFMSVFLSDSGNNRSGWKSAEYDKLVVAARAERDPRERERMYSDAQRILLEEGAVVLPLFYEPNMALVRPGIEGLELNPLNYLELKKVTLAGT